MAVELGALPNGASMNATVLDELMALFNSLWRRKSRRPG
jgi:hypothetical protein